MQYMKTLWQHSLQDAPVEIWSEIDEDRNEIRKLEIFRDGRLQAASEFVCTKDTDLSLEPLPSIEEINGDNQFLAAKVNKTDFDAVWIKWEDSIGNKKW